MISNYLMIFECKSMNDRETNPYEINKNKEPDEKNNCDGQESSFTRLRIRKPSNDKVLPSNSQIYPSSYSLKEFYGLLSNFACFILTFIYTGIPCLIIYLQKIDYELNFKKYDEEWVGTGLEEENLVAAQSIYNSEFQNTLLFFVEKILISIFYRTALKLMSKVYVNKYRLDYLVTHIYLAYLLYFSLFNIHLIFNPRNINLFNTLIFFGVIIFLKFFGKKRVSLLIFSSIYTLEVISNIYLLFANTAYFQAHISKLNEYYDESTNKTISDFLQKYNVNQDNVMIICNSNNATAYTMQDIFSTKILFDIKAVKSFTSKEIIALLVHELSHVKKHDVIFKIIFMFCSSLIDGLFSIYLHLKTEKFLETSESIFLTVTSSYFIKFIFRILGNLINHRSEYIADLNTIHEGYSKEMQQFLLSSAKIESFLYDSSYSYEAINTHPSSKKRIQKLNEQ